MADQSVADDLAGGGQGHVEVLDLFSAAAGGWSLGMHRAGYRTVAACEVEAWRRELYAYNNPHVRLYDDVRTLTATRLRADLGRLPTIIVGSPPCQDISSANTKGRGVEGERSGLYFEAIRIIGECRPRWFALENSANLRTRGADAVIAALEALGYACWPVVVRAGDVGANHERPRCWLVGCDLEQVGHPGFGPIGPIGGVHGWPSADYARGDAIDTPGIGYAGRWSRRYWPHGFSAPSAASCHARHADGQCCAAGLDTATQEGSHDVGAGRLRPDADNGRSRAFPPADAPCLGRDARPGNLEGVDSGVDRCVVGHDDAHCAGDAPVADDGRGAERGADGQGAGQMGLCPPDCGDADRSGPDWSLAYLADHLRLDDGLSAWLAGTRIQVGDGKGQSAASLVVEAFGDAVVPQIPEAIGRAIFRVEAALAAVHERLAA